MSIITYSDVDFQVVPFGGLAGRIRDRFGPALAGMYDFTSPEGLYQDASGTTPVTAYDQPIGLALDRRFGLARGPERVPHPLDFTDGWTATINISAVFGSSFESTGIGTVSLAALEVGKTYEAVIDIASSTASNTRIYNNVAGVGDPLIVPPGSDLPNGSVIFTAANTSLGIRVGSAGEVVVNSISLRELPGHHLTQSTTPARPRFTAQGALHDGVDDFLQAALEDDWTFLHDGSGGTLGISGSWEGGPGSNGVTGTQASSSVSVGVSLGMQSSSAARGYWRAGDGTVAVATQSPSGTWPEQQLKRLVLSYAVPTISRWDDGVRQADLDAGALAPSPSPPSNSLRTVILPNNGAVHFRRRIIAIREAVTDPADIALIDAWLREGA